MQKMLTVIALKAIKIYQKYISPYKGFSCAHRAATNETSCSGYGAKVIKRFGVLAGYKLLNRRFYDCSWHSKQLKTYRPEGSYMGSNLHTRYQRGSIDCDCPDVGDMFDCCEPPDDCGKNKKQSVEFSSKRDKKNKQKYNLKADMASKTQGVDLSKKD